MLKYIGLILLSGGIGMYGAYLSSRLKKCGKQRKSIIELMYAIKNGVEYGGIPLDEVFNSFESDVLFSCGFMNMLRSKAPDCLYNAFMCEGLLLCEREKKLCLEFAKKCGKSGFSDSEAKLCSRYISLLEALDKESSEKEKSKSLLYTRLGILCGLFAALILI